MVEPTIDGSSITMILTEDDLYRASTQYRLWSFTPEALASLRSSTNKAASERVVAAIKRNRQAEAENGDSSNADAGETSNDGPVDCLTAAEELALVTHYTNQTLRIADAFSFPTAVKATAAQYLKRFYISNSPMTYHPKNIFPTCIFLATKTEHHYISLERFTERLNTVTGAKKKLTPEQVIAPEFVITQGLRFIFDVRHPGRGLRGGLMELLAMARGQAGIVPSTNKTPPDLQKEMMAVPLPKSAEENGEIPPPATVANLKELENRCGLAHETARATLALSALLTDVYLLYTPAQIWLAALMLADEPLTRFYISTKFSPEETAQAMLVQILSTIRACAVELAAPSSSSRDELIRVDKKLYRCQNPEKRDLVGLNAAMKRNGADNAGEDASEKAAKKRRMEREELERAGDVFGGPLPTNNG